MHTFPARTFLSPHEAAERAQISERQLTNWCHARPGLAVRTGGRWRIDPAQLDLIVGGKAPQQPRKPRTTPLRSPLPAETRASVALLCEQMAAMQQAIAVLQAEVGYL